MDISTEIRLTEETLARARSRMATAVNKDELRRAIRALQARLTRLRRQQRSR